MSNLVTCSVRVVSSRDGSFTLQLTGPPAALLLVAGSALVSCYVSERMQRGALILQPKKAVKPESAVEWTRGALTTRLRSVQLVLLEPVLSDSLGSESDGSGSGADWTLELDAVPRQLILFVHSLGLDDDDYCYPDPRSRLLYLLKDIEGPFAAPLRNSDNEACYASLILAASIGAVQRRSGRGSLYSSNIDKIEPTVALLLSLSSSSSWVWTAASSDVKQAAVDLLYMLGLVYFQSDEFDKGTAFTVVVPPRQLFNSSFVSPSLSSP